VKLGGAAAGTAVLRINWVHMADRANSGEIGNMKRAKAARLEADRIAPMNERLARMHALCKQMTAIKGAARAR
jgi:hypothetical protein